MHGIFTVRFYLLVSLYMMFVVVDMFVVDVPYLHFVFNISLILNIFIVRFQTWQYPNTHTNRFVINFHGLYVLQVTMDF